MVIEGGEEEKEEGSEDYSMADEKNGLQIQNSWAIQLFDTVCELLAIACICFVRRREKARERERASGNWRRKEVLFLILLLQRLGARTQSLDQAVTAIGSNEPETEEGKNRTLVTTNAKKRHWIHSRRSKGKHCCCCCCQWHCFGYAVCGGAGERALFCSLPSRKERESCSAAGEQTLLR